MGQVRVFIASSIDGFIAGDDNDLSWLPPPGPDGDDHGYSAFMAGVGALLMGRRTFDVVAAFDGPWPFGDMPVLVATSSPLPASTAPGVVAVTGDVRAMVDAARHAAGDRDVYLDGGALIRTALDAGLIDDVIVTLVPRVLGRGVPLFAGVERRHTFDLVSATPRHGLVQLRYRPTPS